MATLRSQFSIDGVIDTKNNVMENINRLCTASGCWLSYDTNTGLWSVIINQATTPVYHFNDSNIVGSINVTGKGINEYYNKVTVQYPNADIRDQTDYVDMIIDPANRFAQELDNTLQITMECINNSTQAQQIGSQELKQSRVDKMIEFRTDFSALGLKAGDVVTVTHPYYEFDHKPFRISKITEDDTDDGSIVLSISAFEYDASVYNNDLTVVARDKKTGIVPKGANAALTASDQAAAANASANSLFNNADFMNNLQSTLASYLGNIGGLPLAEHYHNTLLNGDGSTQQGVQTLISFWPPVVGSYLIQVWVRYGIYYDTALHPAVAPPLGIKKITRLKRWHINQWLPEGGANDSVRCGGEWDDAFNVHTLMWHFDIASDQVGIEQIFGLQLETNYPNSYTDGYLWFPAETGTIVLGDHVYAVIKKLSDTSLG